MLQVKLHRKTFVDPVTGYLQAEVERLVLKPPELGWVPHYGYNSLFPLLMDLLPLVSYYSISFLHHWVVLLWSKRGLRKFYIITNLPAVGPLYTMVKCLDRNILRVLETHPKVIPWKIETEFCVVTIFQVYCKHIRSRALHRVLFHKHPTHGPSTQSSYNKSKVVRYF